MPPELGDDSGSDDEQDDESDETGGALIWRPIRIRFALLHSDGSETELPGRREWLPHDSDLEMLVLVYLFVRSKSPNFRAVGQSVIVPKRTDFGLLLNDIVSRRVPEEVLLHEPQQPNDLSVFKELVVARQHLLESFDRDGLCIESIADYIDFYSTWISESRVALTPDGVRRADVSCLLETDMISVGDSVRWMLLTHPIRLKWFSRYLIEARRLIIAALSSELSLSTAQSVFYTRWLSNCSPEQQPPVYASGDGTVVFPRETVGYCTQYVPRDTGVLSSRSNSAGIGRVARQMTAYLSAHPYKEDGLAVLLYLPDDVRICEAIAHAIKSSSSREAALEFIVVSPRKDWIKFSRAAQQVADRSRLDLDNRLFPRFNLQFLEPDVFIREVGAGDLKVDISVVTHLMRNNVVLQEQTILPSGVSGSFDPLLDNPVHLRETSGGEALSLSMRPGPDISDLLLDSFQTTIVRHFRQKAVSEDQPENTDFFELAVDFQPTSKLFNSLHRVSHWVITLERHITRQQIEKLETNPEILSIEEGVGGISDSTLIVSSNAGKDLIVSRLTRKLQSLLYKTRYAGLADPLLKKVSEYVYESTRKLAPRLALKAMGVSWVTEEMLGLMMAKSKCNLSSTQLDASLSALSTLSLDEHARWFGGSGETRPDFVNILFSIDHEDNLRVSIEVVEAKFRQDYVKHGVLQVQEGIKFFEEVLTNVTRVDSALWRQQIIRAIGAANRDLLQVSGSSELRDSKGLPAKIAEKFKTGNFICGDVRGLFSICLAAETDAPHTSEFDGKVEVSRSTICDLLEKILRDISVDPPEFNSSPAEGIPSSLQSGEGIKAAGSDDHSNTARPLQPETVTSEATEELPSGNPIDTKSTLGSKGKMSQVELQRMYQQIIETLDDHSIRVSVVPAEDEPIVEGPASIVFKVLPASNVDPSRLAAKAEALKLKLRLEANQHISFRTVRGYSNIDVPKLPEQRYFIDAAALWSRAESQTGSLVAPIGENGTGEIVVIDFSDSNSPHLLIGGTTGSGKSEALNVILYGLMKFYSPAELRLLLIDPKGTEMLDIQGSKYLESEIGWIDEDAISILERAVSEMQLRYERLRDARVRTIAEFNAKCVASEKLPWWVIVLDEYQDLTADVENKKLIEAHLKRLAAKARAAGIHLIIATQKPSGDVISTNLRSNLPAQIALRVRSQIESRVIMDESGAELLNGRGDAYFKSAKGLIRVQCAYVAPKDKKHILARDT